MLQPLPASLCLDDPIRCHRLGSNVVDFKNPYEGILKQHSVTVGSDLNRVEAIGKSCLVEGIRLGPGKQGEAKRYSRDRHERGASLRRKTSRIPIHAREYSTNNSDSNSRIAFQSARRLESRSMVGLLSSACSRLRKAQMGQPRALPIQRSEGWEQPQAPFGRDLRVSCE